jgi:hypothetical protein
MQQPSRGGLQCPDRAHDRAAERRRQARQARELRERLLADGDDVSLLLARKLQRVQSSQTYPQTAQSPRFCSGSCGSSCGGSCDGASII